MSDIDALIERWRSGDERAAEAIYTQSRGPIFGLAYALSRIDRYDPQRARCTTWLHTITVSRCRNKRRRQFLPSVPLFAWLEGGNDEADPAPALEMRIMQQDAQDEVWAAICALSQPLREAILLRHWADHSYQEMAQILGCPLRTAQSRVRLAHQQLKTRLAAASFATQPRESYD